MNKKYILDKIIMQKVKKGEKMKKLFIYLRGSVKIISLIVAALIIIALAIYFIYKPIYSVTLNGEFIGYTQDKGALQEKINEYMKNGEGEHVEFVQIDNMPEYKMCLLKKDIVTNDDEIFEKVKATGVTYYKYYAIVEDDEEKEYVASFEDAEEIIDTLKEKNSTNKENLNIIEKYETSCAEFTEVDDAVEELYVAPVVKKTAVATAQAGYATANTSSTVVPLGISLTKPVSGTISSRYGTRWGSVHKGLDIAAPAGTPVVAAASGTVTQAGWNSGGYGYLVVISHGNGVETYYAHNSSVAVSKGQSVSAGQVISYVGSTGQSTGNHLHFEIRVNGQTQNPQNYLY